MPRPLDDYPRPTYDTAQSHAWVNRIRVSRFRVEPHANYPDSTLYTNTRYRLTELARQAAIDRQNQEIDSRPIIPPREAARRRVRFLLPGSSSIFSPRDDLMASTRRCHQCGAVVE